MDNTITLTLIKPLILESVKNETFQRGKFDKAIDPKAISAAYVEQAGNEDYHERILSRSLYTSLEELKTHLCDYLSSNGASTGDNLTSEESGDDIIISLVVSDRFNHSYTDSLAKLSSKYIEESMLMDWWRPINEKQSALYASFVERDLQAIKRCFNKIAPSAPAYRYPTSITVPGSAIDIGIGESYTVTYSISENSVDDVEVRIEDPSVCQAGRCSEGFTVKGSRLGHTYIQLYSRHNPQVAASVQVYVSDQS